MNENSTTKILPPLASKRRVIRGERKCALQLALERKLASNPKANIRPSAIQDNSEKWFDTPPETIGEKIEFMQKMGNLSQWLRNLKA